MGEGVIRSLKAQYPKNAVRKIIWSVAKKTLAKISLLQRMQVLIAALDVMATKTIVNCFQKFKISKERQKEAISEDSNLFEEMEEEIEKLRSI